MFPKNECVNASRKAYLKAYYQRPDVATNKCLYCGKATRYDRKYCSLQCYYFTSRQKPKRITKTCQDCRKQFSCYINCAHQANRCKECQALFTRQRGLALNKVWMRTHNTRKREIARNYYRRNRANCKLKVASYNNNTNPNRLYRQGYYNPCELNLAHRHICRLFEGKQCPICRKLVPAGHAKVCSEQCRKEKQKGYNKRYREKNKARLKAYHQLKNRLGAGD